MSEAVKKVHRGRVLQMPVYLGKQLRGFIYQNDWKVLPMAAVIAALVSMVVRGSFFVSMEGTLKGAFALTFVAIWNGCFNSIQVICRERGILKREHRSGLHISAYVLSHMVYQALLCLAQTVLTLYVSRLCGVRFDLGRPLFTSWTIVDIGITVFLITYASDMMSLFISSMVHTTTAAMTVMPFILIFQLVFAGGFFALPGWASNISKLTVSSYGLKCISAQADYNSLPSTVGWTSVEKMENERITFSVTVGDAVGMLTDESNPVGKTLGGIEIAGGITISDAAQMSIVTGLVDPDKTVEAGTSIGEIIDLVGRERVKDLVMTRTAISNPAYEYSRDNITGCWRSLCIFILLFALLSMISLKRIDRDRR